MKLTLIYFGSGDWAHIYAGDERVYCGHETDIEHSMLIDLVFDHGITSYEEYRVSPQDWRILSPFERVKDMSLFFNNPEWEPRLVAKNVSNRFVD